MMGGLRKAQGDPLFASQMRAGDHQPGRGWQVQTKEEEVVAPLCPAVLWCSSPHGTMGARGSQGFRKGHEQQCFGGLFNAKTPSLCPRRPQVSGG